MKQQIHTGTILLLLVTGTVVLLFAIYKLAALLVLMLIALVLAAGIDPLVKGLQRMCRLPRTLATMIVLVLAVCLFVGAVAMPVSLAVQEAVGFAQNDKLQHGMLLWATQLAKKYPFLPAPTALFHWFGTQYGRLGDYLWSTTQAVFGFLGSLCSLFIVGILTLFISGAKDGIITTGLRFFPPRHRARALEVGRLAGARMGGWLRGQVTLAIIIALTIWLAMLTLGMADGPEGVMTQYATLIAITGGLGELIPMVGPAAGFVLAVIIALLNHEPLWVMIMIPVFFPALSLCESYLLAPKVMQRHAHLPPITTITALMIGGTLLGVVGAVLAIPLTAAGRVILYEVVFPWIQGPPETVVEIPAEALVGE